MAWSRIFWSPAVFLAISAHCARGMAQFPTYEYIGGFSLASDICAPAGTAQTTAIASAHSPTKTLLIFLFMVSFHSSVSYLKPLFARKLTRSLLGTLAHARHSRRALIP